MNSSLHVRVGLVSAVIAVASLTASAANPDHVAQVKKTHDCAGCDLTAASLGGLQAPKGRLANANFSDASLYGANLREADLTGAIFDRADLRMADLRDAIGAVLATAVTDERTVCPSGAAGPCK